MVFRKDTKMGKDTFISLAFLLLLKKKYLFCKLQLFLQNTDAFHMDFYICQRTIDKYINLQIPKEK